MKRFIILAVLLFPCLAFSTPVLINDVPAYNQGSTPWCGFVAPMEVFGYWDMHGYDSLVTPTGQATFLTANVWPDVEYMVQLYVDNLADNTYNTAANIRDYAAHKGYLFTVTEYYHTATWDRIVNEINAGYPLVIGIDIPQGLHLSPAVGYNPDTKSVGIYSNWAEEESVQWFPWGDGSKIWDEITMRPPSMLSLQAVQAVPEPQTIFLIGLGLLGVGLIRLRSRGVRSVS